MAEKNKVKIAAVQMEPKLMAITENLNRMKSMTREAASKKADLIVFPECSLTGYFFNGRTEAIPYAETIPGPSSEELALFCRELQVLVMYGLLEKNGDRLYNAAALTGPQGLIAGYRKNHLPFLGADRFVDLDHQPIEPHKTPIGTIGLQICYDIAFPESARVLTLLGAEILALSTNFPQGRAEKYRHVICTRAFENRVYVVSANRVGTERGHSFGGLSMIADVSGEILSQASPDREEIIFAEVDPSQARQKHQVVVPGEWEYDYLAARRPELYSVITKTGQKRG
jgi:predicted amidohydrolase